MKIYCLLIDAMPLVDEIKEFAKQKGFTISTQVGACFTTPTLYGMFTGHLTSDLLPQGTGYHFMGRKDITKFKWFHDKSINLIDILKEQNYKFNICGNRHAFIARDILCLPALSDKFTYNLDVTGDNHRATYYRFDMYKNALESSDRLSHVNMITSNPNGTNDFFTFDEYDIPDLREKFYQNESINIKKEQNKKQDIFCFWQSLEWSNRTWGNKITTDQEAIKNVMRWLSFWDTEEDAYFWIFSDHGDSADAEMSPKSYLSWVLTKDNTRQKSKLNIKPVISNLDFYQTILDKIGYNKNSSFSKNVYEPPDTERLYFFEDSRAGICMTHANAASVVKVLYDEEKVPTKLVQLCYHLTLPAGHPPSLYVFQYDFKTKNALQSKKGISDSEIEYLKKELFNRIEWLDPEQRDSIPFLDDETRMLPRHITKRVKYEV